MKIDTSKVQNLTISEDESGQRVDNFLFRTLKGVPKSKVYRIIRKGEVRINKKRVKPETKLAPGDILRVPPVRVAEATEGPSANLAQVKNLEHCVVYEDDGVLVLNKPSGLAVHGGSGLKFGMIEALRSLRPEQHYFELVHRLDRDTSGLIMVAKKRSVLRALHAQLREKTVQKDYLALVHGIWPKTTRQVEEPLAKNVLASGERMVKVDYTEGKPSLTRFKIERQFGDMTLVKASPVTGRTHQIRVHTLCQGHVIAGDDKYCQREDLELSKQFGLKRLFLHAWKLRFENPATGEMMFLEAPLDAELKSVIDTLAK
ncbi:23S rRNA pseudouridine(955/2504/2580) synthase RluC [Alginatibacterium sediminis]|uniref:Pseudouridine synthase n=1 Tax=Alginatibacterium sediminis TaxID=2164068 RepID=A0A420EHG8_9ALTE|nr:23S rRNA pseudouridine(955/2504/2580) synthase RluC [Alginatibacterium sediminis]RKF20139.1 23S rRNA pseudouridine(955/2504/2580) synthase RluC [Alginatibacterium sediminis]